MRVIPIVVLLLALAVTACGEKKEVKDTVFAPAVQAKDKARGGRQTQGSGGAGTRGREGRRRRRDRGIEESGILTPRRQRMARKRGGFAPGLRAGAGRGSCALRSRPRRYTVSA